MADACNPPAWSAVSTEESAQLRRLTRALPDAVPLSVGAYLHGSAGRGRLRGQSDLDVIVIAGCPLSDTERWNLTRLLLDLSGRYPRQPSGPRPIELTVVVADEIRPWRYPPRCELQYGEWLRADVESGRSLDPFTSPDLAVLLAMAVQCRAPLFGPDPGHVIDPVPTDDLIRATKAGVTGLLESLESDTTNVLLTLARVWHTCDTGTIASKDVAAAWAIRRAPRPVGQVLQRAATAYVDGVPHVWGPITDDARQAAGFLAEMVDGDTHSTR
jgi:streptomycin 3"-adenylyltransferase